MLSDVVICFQMLSDYVRCCQRLSDVVYVVRCCQMLKESDEESPSLCSSSSPLTSDSPLYITRTGNGKLLVRCRSAPCLRSAWCCCASCSSRAPTLPRRPT